MGPNILKQVTKPSAFHVEDEIKICYFNILLWVADLTNELSFLAKWSFLELSQQSSPEYPFCNFKLGSNSG